MTGAMKGRLAAAILFSLVAALIAFAALREKDADPTEDRRARQSELELAPPDSEIIEPDIDTGTLQNVIDLGDQGNWSRVDPITNALKLRLTWQQMNPEPAGRFAIVKPEVWVWEQDFRVHIEADRGQLLWPARKKEMPESGDLTGGVVITLFAAGEPGAEATAQDVPLASLKTNSLHFESALGQLETKDLVVAEGPDMYFRGTGLTLRFSEVQQRLQYARIDKGEVFRFTPQTSSDSSRSTGRDSGGPAQTAKGPARTDEMRKIDMYHAVVSGQIALSHGSRQIESEQISAWARLVNGRIVLDDSVMNSQDSVSSPEGTTADASERPADAGDEAEQDQVTLRWTGPVEIRPLRDAPRELFDDDLFVQFHSPSSNVVQMKDDVTGALASCVSLDLAFTQRVISLLGVGGSHGVRLLVPEQARIETARVDIQFEPDFQSGVGSLVGAGRIESLSDTSIGATIPNELASGAASIRWSGRCDFAFRQHGEDLVFPELITFEQDVTARNEESSLSGELMHARFSTYASSDGAQLSSFLHELTMFDSAMAEAGPDGRIEADELRVLFAPPNDSGDLSPVLASASGSVVAQREGHSLRAGELSANLARGSDGKVVVAEVNAQQRVELLTENGIVVRADRVMADQVRRTAQLTGDSVSISRTTEGDAFKLLGTSMFIDESSRRLDVFGAGTLHYEKGLAASFDYDNVDVSWSESMVFNDRAGEAEFLGRIKAVGTSQSTQSHLARGEHLFIRVTPFSQDSAGGAARELLQVELDGDSNADPIVLASVETRVYDRPVSEQAKVLEALVFMEGAMLDADIAAGTFNIPGKGRLLIEDRREGKSATADAETKADATKIQNLSGTSIFDWLGGFTLDRAAGEASMHRQVRMRHAHHGSDQFTELECERLTSRFLVLNEGSNSEPLLELKEVVSTDAVYVRHDSHHIICDALNYVASTGMLHTAAHEGNRITVYDDLRGVHFTASEARVDLATGRWTARGMGPVRMPDGRSQ